MSSALAAASLILKPEGYSEGRLQTLKPIEKLGTELVTNGSFDTDSNWNKGSATISNGEATMNVVSGGGAYVSQTAFSYTNGNTYVLTATIQGASGSSGKQIKFQDKGNNTGGLSVSNGSITLDESVQNIKIYWTANANSDGIVVSRQSASGTYSFSVDNVSVREVLVDGGDFTFTRGSNLSATRVNSAGLIEKGRENLLLQSNQFDTTWTLNSTSVTSGQAGYDGTNDAWLLNSTTTGFPRIAQNITSSGVSTFSVYAKAATDGFILMRTFGADSTVWFDLTNGTIPNAAGSQYITSNIQSVGNGWYRCSVTFNGSLTSLRVYPASAYGVYSTSGNGVYIQDAQLEAGMVATNYIETGASTVKAGILENTPRLDYSGGATEPSLLLEPNRTNLIEHSEYLTHFNSLLTFNSVTSPEGLVNAVKIVENTNTNMHGIRKTAAFPTNASAVVYTISVFAKKNQRDFVQIQTYADSISSNSNGFDLTNGTITGDSTNHKIEDYGNGWYRCSFTVSISQSTGGYNFIRIAIGKVNSSFYYAGDNTSGLYLYGFQLEQGSYATSYIPNHSGGIATRAADTCSDAATSSTFNDSEGVLYAEIEALGNEDTQRWLSISDGSNVNTIQLGFLNSANNYKIAGTIRLGGNFEAFLAYDLGVVAPTFKKCAIKYKTNDFALWVDGVEVATDTNGSAFPSNTLNELSFTRGDSVQPLQGNVKQVIYFPLLLSDDELATLTTL